MPGKNDLQHSPILDSIAAAEKGTTGEIRVHLSRRWVERDAYARARRIFRGFGMGSEAGRARVLLYVNLRRRKFAIMGSAAAHRVFGQAYWDTLASALRSDLLSTHPEFGVAAAVEELGEALRKHFPAQAGGARTPAPGAKGPAP